MQLELCEHEREKISFEPYPDGCRVKGTRRERRFRLQRQRSLQKKDTESFTLVVNGVTRKK